MDRLWPIVPSDIIKTECEIVDWGTKYVTCLTSAFHKNLLLWLHKSIWNIEVEVVNLQRIVSNATHKGQ